LAKIGVRISQCKGNGPRDFPDAKIEVTLMKKLKVHFSPDTLQDEIGEVLESIKIIDSIFSESGDFKSNASNSIGRNHSAAFATRIVPDKKKARRRDAPQYLQSHRAQIKTSGVS
jgi:hypothetical protein